MPLVRIALRRGHPAGFGRQVGAIVHQAMVDTIDVPPRDVFQVISNMKPTAWSMTPRISTSRAATGSCSSRSR